VSRTAVVTGSASGIGRATRAHLESRGVNVIGVDLHDAEITTDLASPDARAALVEDVRDAAGGTLDAVIACAGVNDKLGATPEAVIRVNYFGMQQTLEVLRPELAKSGAPRAVLVSSTAALRGAEPEIVEACLAGDEQRAVELARASESSPYPSTKQAISRWVRRAATTQDWAGAGIALNAVAPGAVGGERTRNRYDTPEKRAAFFERQPQPLHGIGEPEQVAALLAWLAGDENSLMSGQVVYIDGGFECILRGTEIW
jgi:NAD(P)-dependent dehydrogenase (short-subunit alcohol dehydrogenase family)